MNIVNQTIMKMSILRRLTSVIAALACIVSAMALDLPVKTLKGTKYYYYKVKKNETVYGVSKKLGLTRDEIVSHNPAADDGIKKGMVLYFPYEEYAPKPAQEVVNFAFDSADAAFRSRQCRAVASQQARPRLLQGFPYGCRHPCLA